MGLCRRKGENQKNPRRHTQVARIPMEQCRHMGEMKEKPKAPQSKQRGYPWNSVAARGEVKNPAAPHPGNMAARPIYYIMKTPARALRKAIKSMPLDERNLELATAPPWLLLVAWAAIGRHGTVCAHESPSFLSAGQRRLYRNSSTAYSRASPHVSCVDQTSAWHLGGLLGKTQFRGEQG